MERRLKFSGLSALRHVSPLWPVRIDAVDAPLSAGVADGMRLVAFLPPFATGVLVSGTERLEARRGSGGGVWVGTSLYSPIGSVSLAIGVT